MNGWEIFFYLFCELENYLNKTYLQKSKQQSHVFWILNELVCELGSQVIRLFLGILICQGNGKLKLVTFPLKAEPQTQKNTETQ